MDGALYYPYISVPQSSWWTRTLLYWDTVATITPADYIDRPALHDPGMRELIENELVLQIGPQEVGRDFAPTFERFIALHAADELSRRQNNFRMGKRKRIHADKLMVYRGGLASLMDCGLANSDTGRWIWVEEDTAAEFMAALALVLCESAGSSGWSHSDRPQRERWVPVTDDPSSAKAMLSGLGPIGDSVATTPSVRRAGGELQLREVRSIVLDQLLPVPEGPMNVGALVRFRRRHSDLLPGFRREMERRLEELSRMDDPTRVQRKLDHLASEVEERTDQVGAYLAEAGVRKITRSPLVGFFKFIPGFKDPVENFQELFTDVHADNTYFSEPLTYVAFANLAFVPARRYVTNPLTGIPLMEAMVSPR